MSLSLQQNNVAKYNLMGSYLLLGFEIHCSMLSWLLVFLVDPMLFWWACLCRWLPLYSSQLWVLFVLDFGVALHYKEALWTYLFRVLSAFCIWMAICFSRLRKLSAFISSARVLRCSVFNLDSFYAILGLASHSFPWVLRCFGYECLFFSLLRSECSSSFALSSISDVFSAAWSSWPVMFPAVFWVFSLSSLLYVLPLCVFTSGGGAVPQWRSGGIQSPVLSSLTRKGWS